MVIPNIDFWGIFQLLIDFVLVLMILLLVRRMKAGMRREAVIEASRQLIAMIEPLVKETHSVAGLLEDQLKEKKQLVSRLNEDLDSRIASLNLLLNRAGAFLDGTPGKSRGRVQLSKQQDAILTLYNQHHDVESIAKMLSLPKGEVKLVIDLKAKFLSP